MKEAGLTAEIGQVLMTTLLGKAKILRQVLESKAAGCGLILSEFSSIVILPVNWITITIIIIIIIIIITTTTTIILLLSSPWNDARAKILAVYIYWLALR